MNSELPFRGNSFLEAHASPLSTQFAAAAAKADDDVPLREGWRACSSARASRRSGRPVTAPVAPSGTGYRTQVVVVDVRMPPTHTLEGLVAAQQIRHEFPDIGIMALSAHADVEHAMELLASGQGIGYLLKSRVTDVAKFVDTLERIAKGGSVVDVWSASVAEQVLDGGGGQS